MPYKFNGKELDEETGLYYYGARYMQPITSIWYGIDPLTEKYPDVSAYTYCMGNPVKLVDSDGRVVKFAPGVSEQFKKDYYTAIKHLQQHGLGASLRKLISSERVYYISTPFEGKTCYKTETKTIHWDPETGLQTDNGTVLSPTSTLNHEIGHAARHEQMYVDYNTTYYKVYAETGDVKKSQKAANNVYNNYANSLVVKNSNPYDSKEEERNIKNNEQITALKLGEIQKGMVTRTNHKGKPVKTESVTSNKIINTEEHNE